MDFVWIYIENESYSYKAGIFNELEYSIKSVQKFYQGDVRCFVIGDDPKLDVVHIPVEKYNGASPQPRHMDQIKKLDMLWDSDVNEEFVLMYDDMFILQPTTKAELQTVYGLSEVNDVYEHAKTRQGTTLYRRLWLSTYDYIKTYRDSKGLKTYDWETHLPRFMLKSKLKGLINRLNLRNTAKLSYSLYAAHYTKEAIIMPDDLQSDLWTHKPGMDFDKYLSRKYLNIYDNVIVPEFVTKMKERYD